MAIKSFSHKGLKQFYFHGTQSGLNANHIDSIGFILDAVEASHTLKT